VCYRLFVNIPREEDVTDYLEHQRDIFLAFIGRFCMKYIWQQEPFNLRLHTAATSTYCSSDNTKYRKGRTGPQMICRETAKGCRRTTEDLQENRKGPQRALNVIFSALLTNSNKQCYFYVANTTNHTLYKK